jgi:hypothetical protein
MAGGAGARAPAPAPPVEDVADVIRFEAARGRSVATLALIFGRRQRDIRQILQDTGRDCSRGPGGGPSIPTEPDVRPAPVASETGKAPVPPPPSPIGRRGVPAADLALIEAAVHAGRVTRVAAGGHAGWTPSWWLW